MDNTEAKNDAGGRKKGLISYSAVVLNQATKERLLRRFGKEIPEGWEIKADHMTINMGEIAPELEQYLSWSPGLLVESIAKDDNVIAVGVSGFPSKNPHPHITLAVNKANGAKPKMSNDLTNWVKLKRPLRITGRVEEIPHAWARKEDIDNIKYEE